MLELMRGGAWALDAAREAVEHVVTEGVDALDGATVRHPASAVRLLAPLPRPNSLRDFLVIEEHLRNARRNAGLEEMPGPEWYKLPAHYKGNVDAIYGPDDEVPYPAYTAQLDYELEVCAVIGRAGRRVRAEDATPYIAGFTLYNDWSARDMQMRESSVGIGPGIGKDLGSSLGPCIVTADAWDRDTARLRGTDRRRAMVGRHAGRDALLLRGHHRVRDDGGDAAARRPARQRHDRAAAAGWSRAASCAPARSSSWRPRASACCATPSARRPTCRSAMTGPPPSPRPSARARPPGAGASGSCRRASGGARARSRRGSAPESGRASRSTSSRSSSSSAL